MISRVFLAVGLLAGGSWLCAGGATAQQVDASPHVPAMKTIGQVTPTGPFLLSSFSTRPAPS